MLSAAKHPGISFVCSRQIRGFFTLLDAFRMTRAQRLALRVTGRSLEGENDKKNSSLVTSAIERWKTMECA
jgi:hypothetical protein